MFEGLLQLPWWGYLAYVLCMTHVTIISVTIYLHRCQAHRALELHLAVSHFFRFWLWLTTGMRTRQWAAVHRKHHARCETAEDPHSPQVLGLRTVLGQGAELFRMEAARQETLDKYGSGTPDDWLEHNLYSRFPSAGIGLMLIVDIALFGPIGITLWAVQMAWIPFFAAGIINGVGHYWGYRNFESADASRNIFPWGILIGGEELHNNHHAYASSARLASKWYEFDIGWMYIRILEMLGLATVKKVAPKPRFTTPKPAADLETLQAVIANRYDVLSRYAKSLKRTYRAEVARLKQWSPGDAQSLKALKRAVLRGQAAAGAEKARLAEALKKSKALATAVAMRDELAALWERSTASKEQLLKQLQDWCHRAETSGVPPLVDFSYRLRSYA